MKSDEQVDETAPGVFRYSRPPVACYANYFEVGHNAFEFLLDAGQVEPQSGEVQLLTRIIASPVHAKLLAFLLNQSIEQFERAHHDIPDLTPGDEYGDFAFTQPHEFERLAMGVRRHPRAAPTGGARTPDSKER